MPIIHPIQNPQNPAPVARAAGEVRGEFAAIRSGRTLSELAAQGSPEHQSVASGLARRVDSVFTEGIGVQTPHDAWIQGLRDEMSRHEARLAELEELNAVDDEFDRLMNRVAFIRAIPGVAPAPARPRTEPTNYVPTSGYTADDCSEISRAAALMGRKGGLRGGPARAAALTPERRREIARNAALAMHARRRT